MDVFYRTDPLRQVESGSFWLSDTAEKPGSISWGHPLPRMVIWALFEVKASGRRFYYYYTHCPYREQNEPARTRAAQEIAARLKTLPGNLPIVLTGDFNTTPDSQAHALLTQTLHRMRGSAPVRAAARKPPSTTSPASRTAASTSVAMAAAAACSISALRCSKHSRAAQRTATAVATEVAPTKQATAGSQPWLRYAPAQAGIQ